MARGFPDFTSITRHQRPTSSSDQIGTTYVVAQLVPGLGAVTVPMFTVGAGRQFMQSSGVISCHVDTWQEVIQDVDGFPLMQLSFYHNWLFIDSDIGCGLFLPGETVSMTFVNYNVLPQTFYCALWGNDEPLM